MKHLFNGVAIAAALTIAAPVWVANRRPNDPFIPRSGRQCTRRVCTCTCTGADGDEGPRQTGDSP